MMTETLVKPTRKDFEELLRVNGYPRRLVKKLSQRWSEIVTQEEAEAEDAEAVLDSIRSLVSKTTASR